MILADRIRQYVRDEIIQPARLQGLSSVHIRAHDIHQALGLHNRFPAVCAALDADKFLSYAQVSLIERSDPKQGSTAEWIFVIR